MKKYRLLIIVPAIVATLFLSRSCQNKKPTALEIVGDSIRIADSQAGSARDSSNHHFRSYESAIATYDNYLDLPEHIRDSIRAGYYRDLVERRSNRAARHGDTLRATETRPLQPEKKP